MGKALDRFFSFAQKIKQIKTNIAIYSLYSNVANRFKATSKISISRSPKHFIILSTTVIFIIFPNDEVKTQIVPEPALHWVRTKYRIHRRYRRHWRCAAGSGHRRPWWYRETSLDQLQGRRGRG